MRTRLVTLCCLGASLVVGACASNSRPSLSKLSTYDLARQRHLDNPGSPAPKIFVRGVSSEHVQRELVPYAQVARSVVRDEPSTRNLLTCMHLLDSSHPDAIYYVEGDGAAELAAGLYTKQGDARRSRQSRVQTVAIALREATALLPFRFRPADGVVTHVIDAPAAGGLVEGDTLLALDAQLLPLTEVAWMRCNFQMERLRKQPGDKIRAAWTRAGKGRMDGDVELLPNQKSYRNEPDGLVLPMPKYVPGEADR